MVCRYAFLFLLIPPDLPQSDKSTIHFVALCYVFNISRLTVFFNAEIKKSCTFHILSRVFLAIFLSISSGWLFLRLCRARMAAGLFPPLLSRFSARKMHLKKNVKNSWQKPSFMIKWASRPAKDIKSEYGRVPEWPMGTDCKSAAFSFGGSNPPAPTKKPQRMQVRWGFCFATRLNSSGGWIRTAAAPFSRTISSSARISRTIRTVVTIVYRAS